MTEYESLMQKLKNCKIALRRAAKILDKWIDERIRIEDVIHKHVSKVHGLRGKMHEITSEIRKLKS